ncbi:MAG: COX15/CtaA family protein [Pseudomonadales bacterium]
MPESTLPRRPFEHDRVIGLWLGLCCLTIFAMVVLGGVTRLTGSGLSMVEWEPILGVLPPLSEAEWEDTFAKYRQYPEYRLKNAGMDLTGFKEIFWLEYFHRLLGRGIGLLFALPFLYFLIRRRIDPALTPRLIGLFVLGGLQGLMGWYMVQSGMVDDPHVSQYRLTAHLLLAIVIYVWMLWLVMDLLRGRHRVRVSGGWVRGGYALTGLVLLTIASGGFVAGLKAGFTFNTFPLMNGQWLPDGLMLMEPVWKNLFENIITVQFNHRVLAMALAAIVVVFWWLARRRTDSPAVRRALDLMLAAMSLQIALGISTLLLVVPVPLAAAHQAGAVLLLTAVLNVAHEFRRPDAFG